jgi:hypothetical protein
MKNKRFLARVHKKQTLEIDSTASSGGKGNVKFPWSPLGAAL